jgi:hypothetical protein
MDDLDLDHELGSYEVPRVGVDGTGARHYYASNVDAVIVVDEDGDPEHIQPLEGGPLSRWIEFIENHTDRGWDRQASDWIKVLADAVEEGMSDG